METKTVTEEEVCEHPFSPYIDRNGHIVLYDKDNDLFLVPWTFGEVVASHHGKYYPLMVVERLPFDLDPAVCREVAKAIALIKTGKPVGNKELDILASRIWEAAQKPIDRVWLARRERRLDKVFSLRADHIIRSH